MGCDDMEWYGMALGSIGQSVLDGFKLYWMVLNCSGWFKNVLGGITVFSKVLHCIGWYGMVQYGIGQCWMALYSFEWNGMVQLDRFLYLHVSERVSECLTE